MNEDQNEDENAEKTPKETANNLLVQASLVQECLRARFLKPLMTTAVNQTQNVHPVTNMTEEMKLQTTSEVDFEVVCSVFEERHNSYSGDAMVLLPKNRMLPREEVNWSEWTSVAFLVLILERQFGFVTKTYKK